MTRGKAVTAVVVIFISWITLGVVGIVYTNHVARQSEQRWCGVLSTLDDAYQSQHPTTALGQQLAAQVHDLRVGSGC